MSVGAILTLGLGQFGTVNLLPTLGYLSNATPPTPPVVTPNTPGFLPGRVRELDTRSRYESEEAKHARRIREGTIPPEPVPVQERQEEQAERYRVESSRLAGAIARFRAEADASRKAIARLEATQAKRQTAKAQRELLLKRQALALAQVQEAALLEQMEVLDIAYVAMVSFGLATGAVLQ